jgi:KipI family sensor histidine kinase inhibitor
VSPDLAQLSLLGTTALLFEAPGETSLPTQQRIWALASEAQSWPEVAEAVPGMNNLMVTFATPPVDPEPLGVRLQKAWNAAKPLPLEGRVVELQVTYGGASGPHIADVIAYTGLSLDEVIAIHTEPDYPVYAIGSHPGYCYLGGMDKRIATPRRKVPVLRLPGGSVSIGGPQTGVSASDGPSGWNTIGSTEMVFFDAARPDPCLLRPGDTIRFRAARVIR